MAGYESLGSVLLLPADYSGMCGTRKLKGSGGTLWIPKLCKAAIQGLVWAMVIRWKSLFVLPVCNLRVDRAPVCCGICFPLCWRCTAIILGMIMMKTGGFAELVGHPFVTGLLLVTPCAIDGTMQYGWHIESTNFRRIAFGFLAGCGLPLIARSNFFV
jgi:uncharacterized membrane protein